MHAHARSLIASAAVAFVACFSGTACGVLEPEGERGNLDEARRRWTAQGFTSYEYRLTQLCFCPVEVVRPYIVRVHDGTVVDVRDAETGAAAPSFYRARTVPELFEVIDDALDRNADSLVVEYHAQFGYPTRITIDYDRQTADEELGLRAEALAPLR